MKDEINAIEQALTEAAEAADRVALAKRLSALIGFLDLTQWSGADERGDTPLIAAARSGDAEGVRLWLDWCEADAVNQEGNSALMEAVRAGSLESVKFLAPVSDLEESDANGLGPAQFAVKMDLLEIIQFLAEEKWLSTRDQEALLSDAAQYSSMRCLVFLSDRCERAAIEKGDDVVLQLALTSAIDADQPQAALFLRERERLREAAAGESDPCNGASPVWSAIVRSAPRCLAVFLSGQDWAEQNSFGEGLLEIGLRMCQPRSDKYGGADVQRKECLDLLEKTAPLEHGRDFLARHPDAETFILRARIEAADLESVVSETTEKTRSVARCEPQTEIDGAISENAEKSRKATVSRL